MVCLVQIRRKNAAGHSISLGYTNRASAYELAIVNEETVEGEGAESGRELRDPFSRAQVNGAETLESYEQEAALQPSSGLASAASASTPVFAEPNFPQVSPQHQQQQLPIPPPRSISVVTAIPFIVRESEMMQSIPDHSARVNQDWAVFPEDPGPGPRNAEEAGLSESPKLTLKEFLASERQMGLFYTGGTENEAEMIDAFADSGRRSAEVGLGEGGPPAKGGVQDGNDLDPKGNLRITHV